MAYQALQFELLRDNVLRISHPSLPSTPSTYLTAANAAGATALTVRDNGSFSSSLGGDLLLIGETGNEQTEIVYVNGAITAGTGLTTSTLVFAHPINTPVRKIIFDKIEVFGNSSASSSGATSIATISIDPTAPYTEYIVTGTTYAYYGIRGVRSIATTYNGSYSDFIAAGGFDTDTVGFIINQAFNACGEQIRENGILSKQWAYDQVFLGEQDVARERKKWSWLQEFAYDAGNVTLGVNSLTLPTNIADKNTPSVLQGVRIGVGQNLKAISKAEYDALFLNVSNTTVGTTYASGATSIVLTDSRDFQDSGSFNVYTAGTTIDNVLYTTNTRSTNTVTGVTSNNSGGTAGEPVWNGEPQGIPLRYTVYEGVLYFDTVPDLTTNLVGSNVWLDYYKKVTRVNTDGDSITVPDPLCIQYWLEAMIKKAKAGGKLEANETSWIGYLTKKKRLVDNEVLGQGSSFVPNYIEDSVWP